MILKFHDEAGRLVCQPPCDDVTLVGDALITSNGGPWVVQDLVGRGRVAMDGEPVRGPTLLRDGALLYTGGKRLVVELASLDLPVSPDRHDMGQIATQVVALFPARMWR